VKIFVYFVGKPRDAALNAYAEEFIKRASRYGACEMREIQPAKVDIPKRHPGAWRVYLDPAGKAMTSEAFAGLLDDPRDLVFLIGAHEGLTAAQRQEADRLLSLSPMTFSHELARAVLAEQIFRAFAIRNNHPYVR
jgi:23S rRNA (pseudouridine1915-N3)-methyltransferase